MTLLAGSKHIATTMADDAGSHSDFLSAHSTCDNHAAHGRSNMARLPCALTDVCFRHAGGHLRQVQNVMRSMTAPVRLSDDTLGEQSLLSA